MATSARHFNIIHVLIVVFFTIVFSLVAWGMILLN